jgi:TPR repeat protein
MKPQKINFIINFCVFFVAMISCVQAEKIDNAKKLNILLENAKKESDNEDYQGFIRHIENKNDENIMGAISRIYRLGEYGVRKNIEIAKEWSLMGADHQGTASMYLIANSYLDGINGFPQDTRLALLYYQACAILRDSGCHYRLARFYRDGTLEEFGLKKDVTLAYYHFYAGAGGSITEKRNTDFAAFYKTLNESELNAGRTYTCGMLWISHADWRKCHAILRPIEDFVLSKSK